MSIFHFSQSVPGHRRHVRCAACSPERSYCGLQLFSIWRIERSSAEHCALHQLRNFHFGIRCRRLPKRKRSITFKKRCSLAQLGECRINSTYDVRKVIEVGLLQTHGSVVPTPTPSAGNYPGQCRRGSDHWLRRQCEDLPAMRKLSAAAAFSLVEVTLALGIAAFCLIAVFGLMPVGVQTNRNATSQTAATNIMAAVIADLRATPKARTTDILAIRDHVWNQRPRYTLIAKADARAIVRAQDLVR